MTRRRVDPGASVADLYDHSQVVDQATIFTWPSADHGMADSLDRYVLNRLPAETLGEHTADLARVLVLGIFPEHLGSLTEKLGLGGLERLPFRAKPHRRLNRIRPWFFLTRGRRELVVCVPPGLDYLKHYTSLLRHFYRNRPGVVIESRYYAAAAAALPSWSGLSSLDFAPGASVIVGHVDELATEAQARGGLIEELAGGPYVSLDRLRLPSGRPLYLIGCAFSFWGDIAGRLAAQIYASGAGELIYLGKVGALDRRIELYRDILIPDTFMLAEHDRVLHSPFTVINGLAAMGHGGLHVTTPTILEQSHLQRQALEQLAPRSIDNEIGHMALAALGHQRAGGDAVRFSSVSFATDYVRRSSEHDLPAVFDLSNNRTASARARRRVAMARASAVLLDYCAASNG